MSPCISAGRDGGPVGGDTRKLDPAHRVRPGMFPSGQWRSGTMNWTSVAEREGLSDNGTKAHISLVFPAFCVVKPVWFPVW